MRHYSIPWRKLLLGVGLSIILATSLEGLRLVAEGPFIWKDLVFRWVFIVGLLIAAQWVQPHSVGKWHYVWPWSAVLVIGVGTGMVLVYAVNKATWCAWGALVSLYLLLLWLDTALSARWGTFWSWVVHVLLALAGGITPVAIAQIESQFADEEFFVALQALVLGLFWLLLLGARSLLVQSRTKSTQKGIHLDSRLLASVLTLTAVIGGGVTVRAYQNSFYPSEVSTYKGISSQAPFICGEVQPDPHRFDGEEVFRRLLARVEANPHKGTPEYGMLALGTGERRWAQTFRDSLLSEAAEGRYTGPANSVKSVQHLAALRAYYYPRVRAAFPDLFSDRDVAQLREWFAAINRRALTAEWVDWMYALAFTKWPEGPYENQESGAGLLAMLESGDLAAPGSSPANQDYLERNQRGWEARFRNTDDAFVYQLEWIDNAYFQSLYYGEAPEVNMQLSFDWLLTQALPDGAPLRYNHPARPSLAGVAYLGARLTKDPRYIWLAGRALETLEAEGEYLFAQPGVETPLPMSGRSPTAGSCLLYGNSGLPNQRGPLAPDKIVFRDGWSEDSAYLLLNLRFTGWHRYKATNTITLAYQNGVLAADVLSGETPKWLPRGRSLFRDKRIPRETLNGLLVKRTGMSAVLHTLTGLGSRWAQDPPYYAEVVDFETGDELDWSHTRLKGWRGWQHDRWIYFYHGGGPIIVVDEAEGATGGQAALAWQFTHDVDVEDRWLRLRREGDSAKAYFVPLGSKGRGDVEIEDNNSSMSMICYKPSEGKLRLVTIFLLGQWSEAEIGWEEANQILWIACEEEYVDLSLPKE